MRTLQEIGELIRTQDNRITDQPMFIVQEKVRIYGFDPLYADDYEWVDEGGELAEPEQVVELEKGAAEGLLITNWVKTYYRERWDFVTACFTEQGCEDYLAENGHNHGETRIYVESACYNHEYQTVRKALMAYAEIPEEVTA